MSRAKTDTIDKTTFNGSDLFKNFKHIYICEQNFRKIIDNLGVIYYNCQYEMAEELRYGIIF